MHRKKRLVIISHCILNQNSVVHPLARAKGAYNNVIRKLLDNNLGIYQMPCPEFKYLGENRPPQTREEYNTPQYRKLCYDLAQGIVKDVKEYISHGYHIVGIMGIEESPTCHLGKGKGIFMEVLTDMLETEKIHLETCNIPVDYKEGKEHKVFIEAFDHFLK